MQYIEEAVRVYLRDLNDTDTWESSTSSFGDPVVFAYEEPVNTTCQ